MNMVQKRDLIGKSEKLAIIIITLLEVTYLMVKFGGYEIKTIYNMIIIVFILTAFFVYLYVPPLLMSLLCYIRSKVILTNTTPTDTTHIETTTTDIPYIETTPMDIITETTHIETTPMYIMTEITPTDTTPLETIDNNINNTYIKVDSTNKDNFLGNKNKNKENKNFPCLCGNIFSILFRLKNIPFAGSLLAARTHYKQPLWLFIESCKSGIRPKVLL